MNNKPNTMTAELFLSQLEDAEHQTDVFYEQKHCEKAMIEFAKHHVKLALEKAANRFEHKANKEVIFSAYDINEIK